MTWSIMKPDDDDTNSLIENTLHARIVEAIFERINWLEGSLLATIGEDEIVREQVDLVRRETQWMYNFINSSKEALVELKRQRDTALVDAGFWKKRGTQNATKQIVGNIGIQQDIDVPEAERLLDWMTGDSNLELSRYTERDLKELIARINEELFEEEVLQDAIEEELFDYDDD